MPNYTDNKLLYWVLSICTGIISFLVVILVALLSYFVHQIDLKNDWQDKDRAAIWQALVDQGKQIRAIERHLDTRQQRRIEQGEFYDAP